MWRGEKCKAACGQENIKESKKIHNRKRKKIDTPMGRKCRENEEQT